MPSRLDRFQRQAFLLTILGFSAGYVALGLSLVLAAAIWEGISTRRIPWQRSTLDAPLLSFASAFLLSGLASPYRATALGAWVLAVLTLYLGYGMLHRLIARDPDFVRPLLRTWVVGAVVAALWAATLIWGTDRPAFLPEFDQNALATTLVMAFFMGLWLFFAARGASRALIASGLVGVLAILTLTSSRGAWIGFIVGLAAFLALAGRRNTMRVLLLIVMLGMPTSILTGLHPPLLQRFRSVTSFAPNRDRFALADSALAIFRDHPLVGTGLNTFSMIHLDYKPAYASDLIQHASAHNIYLNMAAEGGVLGAASFAWLVAAGLLAGLRWLRSAASAEERLAATAVVSAFLGVLVHQLFDATILAANLSIGFWSLIGIQAARARTSPVDSPNAWEPSGVAPSRLSVLVVSNGYGEDAAGMALARELLPVVNVTGFPLVGAGGAYTGVRLLEPRRQFPSGGFGLRGSWQTFWEDVRNGTLSHWRAQRSALRNQRGHHDLVVAVGDVYCLWMAAAAGRPIVFIATAKSEYNEPHRWAERVAIRRLASLVFVRDAITADALRRAGIPAQHVGNALMDTIDSTGPATGHEPTVTLLPGSRAGAAQNMAPLLQLTERVGHQLATHFVCALAPSIDMAQVESVAAAVGWSRSGRYELRRDGLGVTLTHAFGDAISAATVVVGLAGTANEQAAGLGKPVVAFPGYGPQFTRRFMDLQKRLLGEALVTTQDWREGADAVVRLLRDPAERTRRGAVGRERMGGSGAVQRIADEILRMLRAG